MIVIEDLGCDHPYARIMGQYRNQSAIVSSCKIVSLLSTNTYPAPCAIAQAAPTFTACAYPWFSGKGATGDARIMLLYV